MTKKEGSETDSPVTQDVPAAPTKTVYPEDVALQQSEAQLAAAESGTAPAPEEAPAAAAAEAAPETQTPPTTPEAAAPVATPAKNEVAGLREANRRERAARHRAELEAAEARGRAQAMEELAAGRAEAAPVATKTPQEQIQVLRAEQKDFAKKFDAGEITAEQLEEERQSREDRIYDIRQAAAPKQEAPRTEDLSLHQATVQLETDYPILRELSLEDVQALEPIAYREAKREGKPIQGGTPAGDLDLRTRIAKLAQKNFGGAAPVAAAPAAPAKPALSAEAQAREKSLKAAGGHPPNVGSMGAGSSAGEPTAAELLQQLDSMTEDQRLAWENANGALLQKILAA